MLKTINYVYKKEHYKQCFSLTFSLYLSHEVTDISEKIASKGLHSSPMSIP